MSKKEVSNYKYPSRFGSHASMINQAATAELNDPDLVVLTDEFGNYSTYKNRLDNGFADPKRFNENRLSKLFSAKKKEEKSVAKK